MDEILDTVLFVGDRPITAADAGTVALVVIGSLLASWLIKRALGAVAARSSADSVRGAVIH
ncbi:MAG: hypothetical protein KC457_32045, partial [Myxococcales bacterium]|nr:hypothetical protein [Myxococcales bacterium]